MAKVKRKKNKDLLSITAKLKDTSLRVGWLDGAKHDNSDLTIAQIAYQNEFGVGDIPARPFMRPALDENKEPWRGIFEVAAKQAVDGSDSYSETLDLLGQRMVGDIKKSIISVQSPALAESTVKSRLSTYKNKGGSVGNLTKPLVFTGQMINSVTYEVSDDT
jgi:hypothetical protein